MTELMNVDLGKIASRILSVMITDFIAPEIEEPKRNFLANDVDPYLVNEIRSNKWTTGCRS